MLRYAAENGYDKLTWTTGEQQADRYDLAKQVDGIDYARKDDGNYTHRVPQGRGAEIHAANDVAPEKLADYVGKDAAQKILDNVGREPGTPEGAGYLTGVDLKVGGEGMRGFYDQILPSAANKLVKRWGGKVGETEIPTGNRVMMFMGLETSYLHRASRWMRQRVVDGMPRVVDTLLNHYRKRVNAAVHSLDITPSMKESLGAEPQPMFKIRPKVEDTSLIDSPERRAARAKWTEELETNRGFADPRDASHKVRPQQRAFLVVGNGDAVRIAHREGAVMSDPTEAANLIPERARFGDMVDNEARNIANDVARRAIEKGQNVVVNHLTPEEADGYEAALKQAGYTVTRTGVPEGVGVGVQQEAGRGARPARGQGTTEEGRVRPAPEADRGDRVPTEEEARAEGLGGVGPGTQRGGTKGVTAPDIKQLQDTLDGIKLSESNLTEPPKPEKPAGAPLAERAKAGARSLAQKYSGTKDYTPLDALVGNWTGERDIVGHNAAMFARKIVAAIPDRLTRQAMSVWHEAGGDEALIRHWIDSGARLEDPSLKAKYQRALELSPDEKTFADNVGNYFDSKWAELHRAGLLDAGLEDYVPHAWEPKDDGTTIATARIPGPDPTKGRVLPTYAAGEDAGFRAKQTDIGELLTKYEEVVGSKLAMARLKDGLRATNAADGKPLAVNERAPGYVQATGTGMQGLWLHADTPGEKIATRINNATGVGHLRDMPGMKAILGFQSTMKETMVSANPFHQIQIGIHGLEHKVNPFDLDPIDLTNERQQKLVRHSLTIGGGGGSSQEFRAAEGLTSGGGWLAKIPGLKAPLEQYTRYVFGADGYIPRMKMKMALDALDRNTKRFEGKLTEDQIYHMTATQANAAFGGINYEFMGRNKTFREFMQLATFAPDFLEARTRFVGQALRPEGTEQRAALLRGAFVMYLGARVANGIFNRNEDGTPNFKFEPENMFSVVINGRRYGIRTVQGDVLHLLTDPRNFYLQPHGSTPPRRGRARHRSRPVRARASASVTSFGTSRRPPPRSGSRGCCASYRAR